MINKSNGIPVYKQIETILWTDINRGIISPGEKLPNEEELAKTFGASRGTLRQALSELANKGFIKRIHGAGTFVCEPKKEFRIEDDHFISFLEGMETSGVLISTFVVGVQNIKATGPLAEKFTQGLPMFEIYRIRKMNSKTVMLLYDYIPMDLFPDIDKRYKGEKCIYDFLEKSNTSQICKVKRIFQAIQASGNVANALSVKEGTPIFYVIQQAFDGFGRCVDYANLFLISEGMQFSFISNR